MQFYLLSLISNLNLFWGRHVLQVLSRPPGCTPELVATAGHSKPSVSASLLLLWVFYRLNLTELFDICFIFHIISLFLLDFLRDSLRVSSLSCWIEPSTNRLRILIISARGGGNTGKHYKLYFLFYSRTLLLLFETFILGQDFVSSRYVAVNFEGLSVVGSPMPCVCVETPIYYPLEKKI